MHHHVRCVVLKHGTNFPITCASAQNNIFKIISVFPTRSTGAISQRLFCSKRRDDGSNEESDSGSQTNNPSKNNANASKAKAKLNDLLKSIIKESKEAEATRKDKPENEISLKLAVPIKEKRPPPVEEVKSAEELEAEQDIGKEMVSAVKKVAEVVEGDRQAVESELVQKLKTQVGKKINLSELFVGMKIDRSSKADPMAPAADAELSRAHRVRRVLSERTREPRRERSDPGTHHQQQQMQRQKRLQEFKPSYAPMDLFGAPPLGIFTSSALEKPAPETTAPKTSKLKTWDALYARDLKLSVTHPPANGFEEMILWTEQGKLWKFPINNEQGLDEEAKVPFHEHVFLEPQIEPWCPKKGPIRHFMELVCVGLSKNPFLTVKEKHEQIEWYHQYFVEKAAIVKEVGAGEIK